MKKAITILFLLLGFYSYSQQFISNIDSLKSALATAKEDSNKVKILNTLSVSHIWSNPDKGIVYAEESISLSKKIKYEQGESDAYSAMGYCLTTLGNYPLALDYLYKSLEYQEKINSKLGQLVVYGGLALAYRDMGEYQQSLYYIRKNLALENQGLGNLNISGILSSVYAKMNQPDSAIYYASIALKLNPNWSGILVVLGDSYYKLNQLDTANYFFDQGIYFAKINRTEIDLVDLYHGKSLVYKSQNQLDSAIIYARKAMLEPFGKFYPRGVLDAITTLSNLYENKNQPDSTLKYLRASITLRDSLFNRERTMAIQNLAFKQQEKQKEIEALRLENRNRIRLNALLGSLFTITVIAFLLLKNNRNRKKANELLQKQKTEVENQKKNVEQTLTELKSTQTQLIQSEKMASLGELTAGIAHEIQNPINFVNNFSEVNQELLHEMNEEIGKGNLDEVKLLVKDAIDNEQKINHHGKRADAIVKGMLQHSRTSNAVKEPTDINALADEYLRLSYHGLRAKDKSFNADFTTDFDPNIPKINVIPQDIGRVLLNLINNAFYAVASKSSVTKDSGYKPEVIVSTTYLGARIEISVKDNGNGIPASIKDKIFQPFFTTKPTGQGTGLGLSLSYDTVKAHGGELKVESEEGKGSEFIIQIPMNGTKKII
jgi:two-component system, NtrC family, sensor kinase